MRMLSSTAATASRKQFGCHRIARIKLRFQSLHLKYERFVIISFITFIEYSYRVCENLAIETSPSWCPRCGCTYLFNRSTMSSTRNAYLEVAHSTEVLAPDVRFWDSSQAAWSAATSPDSKNVRMQRLNWVSLMGIRTLWLDNRGSTGDCRWFVVEFVALLWYISSRLMLMSG